MKKYLSFIILSFICFLSFAKPVYLEVAPDEYRWINLSSVERYDEHGNQILYESDKTKYEHFYLYDSNGNIIQRYDDNNPDESIYYEYKNNLLTREITAEGNKYLYSYNSNKLLTSRQYIDSNTKKNSTLFYEYDANGNLIRKYEDNSDYQVIYEYDENNNLIKEISDSSEKPTTYEYDKNNNLIKKITGSNDKTITYEYDDKNRVIKENCGDRTISYEYQSTKNAVLSTESYKTNNILIKKYDIFDKNNNLIYHSLSYDGTLYETWYIIEYWEDGKTKKTITTYESI